ncbi:hypothetical protein MKX03_024206 [Papaver bracteatum]|nr:hypothetical protein MKX03_024206 [Papaver bracteatum]
MKVIDTKTVEKQWLGSSSKIRSTNGVDSSLSYVSRHEYTINSNWKVFIDNFIDGGYHVPYAHTGFSSEFNLDTYFSIQECESAPKEKDGGALSRIGSRGFYVFDAQDFIDSSIQESERVLMEDIVLCENVQKGLESPSYLTEKICTQC